MQWASFQSPVGIDIPYPISEGIQRRHDGKPNQRCIKEDKNNLEKITDKVHDNLNPHEAFGLYLGLIEPYDNIESLKHLPRRHDYHKRVRKRRLVHHHENNSHDDKKRRRSCGFGNVACTEDFILPLGRSGQLTEHDIVDAQMRKGSKDADKAQRVTQHPISLGLEVARHVNSRDEGNSKRKYLLGNQPECIDKVLSETGGVKKISNHPNSSLDHEAELCLGSGRKKSGDKLMLGFEAH